MVEFNRKKSYKRFIYSPLSLFILFVVFIILLKALWGVYNKELLSAQYLDRGQAELSKIQDRKNELSQSVTYLKTDQGVEDEIRTKFRVVKQGEQVAVIVGDDTENDVATTTATSSPSFWQRVFSFLGF